jgi:hypothetical protein
VAVVLGCHFLRSVVVAVDGGCVSTDFGASGCVISWVEDWVGISSVAVVVAFGCHFFRSGAEGRGLVVVAERF